MSRFSKLPSRMSRQRGDVLLEALVGVLITAIVGAGMAHVASRISIAQHDAKLEALAVSHMRDLLQSKGVGLCTLPESERQLVLPNDTVVTPSVECQAVPADVTLTMGAALVASTVQPDKVPREVILSVAATDLGLSDGDNQPALVVGTRQIPESGS